jgi:hypothetical protein
MPDYPFVNPPSEPQPPVGYYAQTVAPTPPPSPNLDCDITDELTDHLFLAARDLQLAGHPADEAQKLAHQKFGDIASIRRRLWWIQKGDEVMLRIAFAIALVILVVVVAAIGVGGWQMNETINELGATLTSMNETQRALLESREKEDRPLAIRGRLYVGDKSRPASYASVDVVPLPEGKPAQRLLADEDGRFGTSSLTAGHYAVVANLIPRRTDATNATAYVPEFFAVQSRPISVYPWSKDTNVELEVAAVGYGQVSLEFTDPLPQSFEFEFQGEQTRKVAVWPVLGVVIPPINKRLPDLKLVASKDIEWPIIGLKGGGESAHKWFTSDGRLSVPISNSIADSTAAKSDSEKAIVLAGVNNTDVYRAGRYRVAAYLAFGINVDNVADYGLTELVHELNMNDLPAESRAEFDVVHGRRTHLRVSLPKEWEKTLQDEITGTLADPEKYNEVPHKPRPVKLEVVGQLDMVEPELDRQEGVGASGYGRTGYGGAGRRGAGYGTRGRGGSGAYGGAR